VCTYIAFHVWGKAKAKGGRGEGEVEVVESKLHLFGCPQKDLVKISKSEYEKSENFRRNWRNPKECL
jgi:hypothetical protein